MVSETSHRTPNGIVVFLGSAAAFVLVAVFFVILLRGKKPVDQVEHRRAAQRVEVRAKLESEAQERLNSDGWVDKAKGIAHVPIADAMVMVVAELSAKKPAPSSVKVEAPLPMPVIDPAATEPPPAALPSAPQGADTMRFDAPAAAAPSAPASPVPAAAPTPVTAPAPEKPAEPVPAAPATPPVPATPPTPAIPPAAEKPAPPAAPEPPVLPPPANPTENPAPTK